MGSALTPFYGEFLMHPIPIHLSGNWCSHNCSYCFANLNVPDRAMDLHSTLLSIKNYHKHDSLLADLLRLKYPVCVSNHVDPFSISNYRQLVPLMKALIEEEIPIYIQTKGGIQSAIDEILEILPQSVWYISISHDNEETRSLIEKPTPTIEERFELIKRLKKLGHKVQVGINPLHPDWIQNPRHFLVTLKSLGVDSVYFQPLTFTVNQVKNMTEKSKSALGDDVKDALTNHKKPLNDRYRDFLEFFKEECKLLRISYFLPGDYDYSKSMNIFDIYEKVFPTIQDFINYCHVQRITVFSFQDYWNYFSSWLPDLKHSVHHKYLTSKVQINKINFEIPKGKLGYKDILYLSWLSERIGLHPINYISFAYLVDDNNNKILDNKYRLPQFVFNKKGW